MFKEYVNLYSVILMIIILIAVISFFVIPKQQESFAAIYILNSEGSFGNYSDDIIIGVTNNLGYETEFTVFYKKDNNTVNSWNILLSDNQSHEFEVHLENKTGTDVFELWYKNEDNWLNSGKWVSLKQD